MLWGNPLILVDFTSIIGVPTAFFNGFLPLSNPYISQAVHRDALALLRDTHLLHCAAQNRIIVKRARGDILHSLVQGALRRF